MMLLSKIKTIKGEKSMKSKNAAKRLMSFAVVLVLLFVYVPTTAYANESTIQVRVIAEGLQFDSVGSQPDWYSGRYAAFQSRMAGFSEGLLAVERNGRMGFIDRTGNIVIPLDYYVVHTFSEGLALVENNNRFGFIDRAGRVVVPLTYANAMAFSEGLAMVRTGGRTGSGRTGFIDITGNVVVPLIYDFAQSFSDGRAVVTNHPNWGIIDRTGRVVIPTELPESGRNTRNFSEGRVAVTSVDAPFNPFGHWGFADENGAIVIPTTLGEVGDFSEGLAWVRSSNGIGFIDRSGNMAIPNSSENRLAGDFSEGFARVSSVAFVRVGNSVHTNPRAGEWGFINRMGAVITSTRYTFASDFRNGLARVSIDGKEGFIDTTGNLVIPMMYDSLERFWLRDFDLAFHGEDAIWLNEDKSSAFEYMMHRNDGWYLSQTTAADFFESIRYFNDGLAVVTRDGRWGAIDRTGREVVPLIYDFVFPFNEGLSAALRSDGTWSILEIVGSSDTSQALTPPIAAQPSSWAVEQVNAAIAAGLVPQNLQSAYTQVTTRAEFAALAVALYETVTGTEITGRMQFSDTSDVNVQKMGYLGVVTGVGGGNFAPNNTLTREQAAVMLARLAYAIGQPIPASAPTFADNNQISSWAIDGVGQMQSSGIMGGVGNNQFAPLGNYTREQSIVTMMRLFDLLD